MPSKRYNNLETQLFRDKLFSTQLKGYIKFKEREEYGEEFKLDILKQLNVKLKEVDVISKDNIIEIIKLFIKANPSKGSLAHWSGLDALKKYAEMNIKDACYKWNILLDSTLNINERVNNFINISVKDQKIFKSSYDGLVFRVGLDTVAYILAGFNLKKYPVYKFNIYKEFTELYGLERVTNDFGEIYADYIKINKLISDEMSKLNYIENPTVFDGQDFIYCTTNYDSLKIETLVEYIYNISEVLKSFKEDNSLLISYINKKDKKYLKNLIEVYKDSEKINGIREDIAIYLYEGNILTLEKFKEIKRKEAKKHDTNILRSWKDFGILLPFYYRNIRSRVEKSLDNIIKSLKNIDPELKDYNSHKVGFEGIVNFGSLRCWIVLYPEKIESHRDSKQLFMNIGQEDDSLAVSYGFHTGSNISSFPESDLERVDIENFSYNNMVEKFKEVYYKYFKNQVKIRNKKIDKAYFVGAVIGSEDLSDEFIEKGIWKRDGYDNKISNLVKNIEVGDKIAIKSTYTRKKGLPFEANDNYVSTMRIKAIGNVTKNLGDGKELEVDWDRVNSTKEWYFSTLRETISKVERSDEDWISRELLDFTFNNKEQNIEKFLNQPYWYNIYVKDGNGEDTYNQESLEINFENPLNLDSLYFEDKDTLRTQIYAALKSGKSIILIGPPGTGKSKLASCIANSYRANFKVVTAMSDWSSYDTIGGYKPDEDGALYFEEGIFLNCLKDKYENFRNQWLIIDEINRADIDKAFGPFLSALSGDDIELGIKDKGRNIEIVLEENLDENPTFSGNQYLIPEDWRIIGTMNTFDKTSLYEMSYAFMRRFAFIPVAIPKRIDENLVEKLCKLWKIDIETESYSHISQLWKIINEYRKIGPAIIEDMARFISLAGDYTSGIVIYILPQLEGLFDDRIADFVEQLVALSFIKGDERLKSSVEDFFNMKLSGKYYESS